MMYCVELRPQPGLCYTLVVDALNARHALAAVSRTCRIEIGVLREQNRQLGRDLDWDEYAHIRRCQETLRTVRKPYRRHKPDNWMWTKPVPFVTVNLIPQGIACNAAYFGYGINGDRSILRRQPFQPQELNKDRKNPLSEA